MLTGGETVAFICVIFFFILFASYIGYLCGIQIYYNPYKKAKRIIYKLRYKNRQLKKEGK